MTEHSKTGDSNLVATGKPNQNNIQNKSQSPIAFTNNEVKKSISNNKRGKKPSTRNKVTSKMINDYKDNPEKLKSEKQDNLSIQYGHCRELVNNARKDALKSLSAN